MTATPTIGQITPPRGGPGRQRGFTIVEILVVVGILLVLVGIAAVAYRGLDPSARATKGTLQNLQAMLAEYEAAASLPQNQPPQMWRNGAKVNTGTAAANIWREKADVNSAPRGVVSSGSPERYDWDAVLNTQLVYRTINRIPANKQALGRIPKVLHGQVESGYTGAKKLEPTGGTPTIDPPLVLDAWENPIIFVGSEGLWHVGVEKRRDAPGVAPADFNFVKKVTSVGVFDPGPATDPPPAGARPFFASAGPDGNFRTHEDNVYSFEE